VPPDDISSVYSYQRCVLVRTDSNGSTECIFTATDIMDVLKITPPFFYSYQCGSTLLTSYIPVHMYSISLQVLSTILTMVIIFSSTNTRYPHWLLSLFPGVCWPDHGQSVVGSSPNIEKKPSLVQPHQIISKTMNNIVLLLSFGLCSPVLCLWIAVSICVHLCSWSLLIDRFVSIRIDALHASGSYLPSAPLDRGFLLLSNPSDLSPLHSLQKHRLATRPSVTRSSISWISNSRASIPLSWSASGR
jgi:hypothetical protein